MWRRGGHLARYGDEDDGRDLSPHSSDSPTISEDMTSIEETLNTIEEQKEAYDTSETLPWWVIAPREQRDPQLPASSLTDTQLYFVVQTRLTAKERRDKYPEKFDMRGIPLRGRPNRRAP